MREHTLSRGDGGGAATEAALAVVAIGAILVFIEYSVNRFEY
jgi:hypothetical protein